MNQQEEPDESEGRTEVQAPSPFLKAYVDQQIQNAIKEYEQSQTKVKKWRNSWRSASPITKGSFSLTAGIAVATIAYAIIAWSQLRAMREISQDTGQQTQQLIDAANQLKQAAWQFEGSAQGIDGNIGNAVEKLNLQAQATSHVADAAAKQADQALAQSNATQAIAKASSEAIDVQNRPWVTADIKPGAIGMSATDGQASFFFSFRNIGKSLARNIRVYAALAASNRDPIEIQDLICDNPGKSPWGDGFDMFPNEANSIHPGLSIPIGVPKGAKYMNFNLVGCIVYLPSFTRDRPYQTRFNYHLVNGNGKPGFQVGGQSPPDQINMGIDPYKGNHAY